MKKVFFVIPSMGGGGAERVFLHILRNIDRATFLPVLVLFEKKGEYLDHVPEDVKILELKETKERNILYGATFLKMAIRLSVLLKRENPDALLSFMWYTNLISIFATKIFRNKIPIIISERYSLIDSSEGFIEEQIRRAVVKYLYGYSDAAIVNSFALKEQLLLFSKMPKDKILVIYNPVDLDSVNALSCSEDGKSISGDRPVVVGMGRLTPQKGFRYLIKAIGILNSRSVPCDCWILGEGSERARLDKLSAELGVRDRIRFLGFQRNPYRSIVCADIFVLPSLYEGFPNALLEAMALGVPVVATRCPTGPDEIIDPGRNGILVDPRDEIGLANAISELLRDDTRRNEIGKAGRERVHDFSVRNIVREYENALMRIISG
jgi:glycosyltransferase involved in cell wall biosynthesis